MPDDTPTPAGVSILEGLAALSANENLTVGKDGFNQHFNYGYMTEAALFTAARAAMAEVGLSGTISFVEGSHEHITTAHRDDNGNQFERPAVMATVTAELAIRDKNGQAVLCRAFGQGVDSADKAYAKAMTMAAKYVVQKALLCAVESDDADTGNSGAVAGRGRSSGGSAGGGPASEKQLGFLCSLVKKLHIVPSGADSITTEGAAWRLARMQGDPADVFAKISKGTASALIEKLKATDEKVADADTAGAVILDRLAAWEAENTAAPASEPAPAEPTGDHNTDDDDVPF